jgi:amino acid transporter
MNSFLTKFFNWDYLSEIPVGALYETYFLYLVILTAAIPIAIKIFFKIQKRSKAYQKFDRQWLWGYISLALVGLFIWFSITQQLPTFGSRLMVYIWIFALILFKIYLLIYYRRVVVGEVKNYHEKKRKEKYLH